MFDVDTNDQPGVYRLALERTMYRWHKDPEEIGEIERARHSCAFEILVSGRLTALG